MPGPESVQSDGQLGWAEGEVEQLDEVVVDLVQDSDEVGGDLKVRSLDLLARIH